MRSKVQKEINESNKVLGKLTDKQLEQYASNEDYKKGSSLGGFLVGNRPESKKHMKKIQKIGCIIGGKVREIPVFSFSKDGKFIKEYTSATHASNELKIHRSDITAVCKGRGRLKTVGGLIWKYKK